MTQSSSPSVNDPQRFTLIEDKWLRGKKEIDENWNYENILILQFISTRTFCSLAFF